MSRHQQERRHGQVDRVRDPLQPDPTTWDVQPLPAVDLVDGRLIRIQPPVRVALERVACVGRYIHDAVEDDDPAELLASIDRRVADAVLTCRAGDDQVAGLDPRTHAGSVGRHVGDRPAQCRGPGEQPEGQSRDTDRRGLGRSGHRPILRESRDWAVREHRQGGALQQF